MNIQTNLLGRLVSDRTANSNEVYEIVAVYLEVIANARPQVVALIVSAKDGMFNKIRLDFRTGDREWYLLEPIAENEWQHRLPSVNG
jgi:hypothetical protein